MRIFVLEDDVFIALDLANLLRDAGYEVIGPAATLQQGWDLLAEAEPEFAILDANIRGEAPADLAKELVRRGIPYVYLSGYAREDLDGTLPDGPFLSKPVRIPDLTAMIDREAAARSSRNG